MRTIFSLAIVAILALAGTAQGGTLDENIAKLTSAFERVVILNRDSESAYCAIASTETAAIIKQKECQADFSTYRALMRDTLNKQIRWQYAAHDGKKEADMYKREADQAFSQAQEQLKLLGKKYPKKLSQL